MSSNVKRSLQIIIEKKGIPGVIQFLSEELGDNTKKVLKEEKILIKKGAQLVPNTTLLYSMFN